MSVLCEVKRMTKISYNVLVVARALLGGCCKGNITGFISVFWMVAIALLNGWFLAHMTE